MLSDTEEGREALTLLFALYEEHKGTSACDLAHKLGTKIECRVWDDALGGLISFFESPPLITYSHLAEHTARDYIIYHELGHFCLYTAGSRLFNPIKHSDEHASVENCCNNFATALLFAHSGVQLMSHATYASFMDEGIVFEGDACTFHGESDVYHGQRIIQYANKHFSKDHPSRKDLILFGRRLVDNGGKLLEECEENPSA